MAYIDVFVMPVLLSREADYLKWAEVGRTVWLEHGALSYAENRADDVPLGQLTSFPRALLLEEGEVIYFSYATYRDRAHRDEVMQRVMGDERVQGMMTDSPADMKRMIWGGFVPTVVG